MLNNDLWESLKKGKNLDSSVFYSIYSKSTSPEEQVDDGIIFCDVLKYTYDDEDLIEQITGDNPSNDFYWGNHPTLAVSLAIYHPVHKACIIGITENPFKDNINSHQYVWELL